MTKLLFYGILLLDGEGRETGTHHSSLTDDSKRREENRGSPPTGVIKKRSDACQIREGIPPYDRGYDPGLVFKLIY